MDGTSWKIKGIVLTAPLTDEIDDVIKLIEEFLAPKGFNLLVLQVRYRYQFKNHPEVRGYDPLSYEDVKRILSVCKKHAIRLVPKMNLIGHQSGVHNTPTDGILHGHNEKSSDIPDGLLRAYPDFDEERGQGEISYARSLCLSNKEAQRTVFELIDELMDVFEADVIHVGCDEAFSIGTCESCRNIPKSKLLANWINGLNEHVKARGGRIMMWGDRLISAKENGYDRWEASDNGTDGARASLSRDIIICDWHYGKVEKYPSVDIFATEGFKILVSPWRDKEGAVALLNYAKEHDKGHVLGVLTTTWCGSGDLAKHVLYGEKGRWQHTEEIANTLKELY